MSTGLRILLEIAACYGLLELRNAFRDGIVRGLLAATSLLILTVVGWLEAYHLIEQHISPTAAYYFFRIYPVLVGGIVLISIRQSPDKWVLRLARRTFRRMALATEQAVAALSAPWRIRERLRSRRFLILGVFVVAFVLAGTWSWWQSSRREAIDSALRKIEEIARQIQDPPGLLPEIETSLKRAYFRELRGAVDEVIGGVQSEIDGVRRAAEEHLNIIASVPAGEIEAARTRIEEVATAAAAKAPAFIRTAGEFETGRVIEALINGQRSKLIAEGITAIDTTRSRGLEMLRARLSAMDSNDLSLAVRELGQALAQQAEQAAMDAMSQSAQRSFDGARLQLETAIRRRALEERSLTTSAMRKGMDEILATLPRNVPPVTPAAPANIQQKPRTSGQPQTPATVPSTQSSLGTQENPETVRRLRELDQLETQLTKMGFNFRAEVMLTGGTTLGSAQLAYQVASIGECARYCSVIGRCTGFSFETEASPSTRKHSCHLFGGRPSGLGSKSWMSGTRF